MARKVRTPPPPRRVQAPKRRDTPRGGGTGDQGRQRLILYGVAGSGIAMLVAVGLFLALAARGGTDVAKAMTGAGCTFKTYPSEGRSHVTNLNAKVDYKTFPPTSGTHYAIPAVWDIYDRPVSELQAVHNLEHGGIIIQYGDKVPPATVDRIAGFYRESPNGMLVAPLPGLGNKIALTAWTKLATCTAFNEEGFTAFRNAYRGKGPEPYKTDDLQPGGT